MQESAGNYEKGQTSSEKFRGILRMTCTLSNLRARPLRRRATRNHLLYTVSSAMPSLPM